jgi:hypothetical protein
MLTVKVIRPDGSEWIEEATSVAINTPEQSPNNNKSVTYFVPDKTHFSIDIFEGQIYVMNENGKTVANYFLAPIKS